MMSIKERRALGRAISDKHKAFLHQYCNECSMRGEGLSSILKSIGSFGTKAVRYMTPAAKAMVKELKPIVKAVGPVVLKEIIVPMLKKKFLGKGMVMYKGKGLTPAGGGLRLAGQRGKGAKSTNKWLVHVNKVRVDNPRLTYKEALKLSSRTYVKE